MNGIECISVIDERSAGFIALGIAQQTQEVVALICTSGSAMLNYAPALAEAFYQKVPLLVLSADRPNEWIDQGENQSINQNEVYKNYIKKSYQLPVQVNTTKDLWYCDRTVAEAINSCKYPDFGPVHVNIPLREPLYTLVDDKQVKPKIIDFEKPEYSIDKDAMTALSAEWNQYRKIMIVVGGLKNKAEALDQVLQDLSQSSHVVVLKESISNVYGDNFIDQIDQNVELVQGLRDDKYVPDLVVTLGAGVVSKKLKFWLRKQEKLDHWHITNSFEHWDIFQSLSKVLQHDAIGLLSSMMNIQTTVSSSFKEDWMALNTKTQKALRTYLSSNEFNDFKVFEYLIQNIPKSSLLQLGNSTPVRYANLLHIEQGKDLAINSNRGVSGIDGVLSTAVGASLVDSDKLCFCICGDVAALYDSNALMNAKDKPNLKLILINNQGGNIFKIIPGPDQLDELEQFFETKHDYEFSELASMHSCKYYKASSMEELQNSFSDFIEEHKESAILEIRTDGTESAKYLRGYFDYLNEEITLN